jgi:hypothetical protein
LFRALGFLAYANCRIVSSQPTSSASAVLIDLSEYGVKRMKSIVFLNGYLEPSLLILHEPELTWGNYTNILSLFVNLLFAAGRTAVKPATCIMTAISINIDTCKHFLIANEKVFGMQFIFELFRPRCLGFVLRHTYCASAGNANRWRFGRIV